MTDLQRLENAITELIGAHECVVVPNLGAFLLRSFPASANPFSGEIKPSGQTLFFNPSITSDDGLLVTHLRYQTGYDYIAAQKSIQELVSLILEGVKLNRSYPLGKLGNFFMHHEGKLLFLPSSALNVSKNAFGLGSLMVEEIMKNRYASPVVNTAANAESTPLTKSMDAAEEIQEAEIIELQLNQPKSRGFIWKIAATVCLVSLSAAAIYYGNFISNTGRNLQFASHLPTKQSPEPALLNSENIDAESNKKSSMSVSLLSAEDMYREMETLKTGKGNVFICGGSYMSQQLAENECKSWRKNGIPAVIGKKKGSILIKVVVGRFENDKDASEFLEKLPVNTGFHAGLLTAQLIFN
jgi:hypothetical protein